MKKLDIDSTIYCDVLIIGAGGAGLRCAAEVLEHNPSAKIVAVTKGVHPQKSHTGTAQGGLSAVDPKDPIDKPIYHMFDTWKGSDCMADQNVVKRIVESAWEQIIWLENHGMHFSRDENGRLSRRTFGGHTLRFGETSAFRAVFEADRTGKGIMDTVWGEALRHKVEFVNQAIATELLFNKNQCVGAILFIIKEGKFIKVLAKTTVLSTGGSGQMFKVTTNCRQNTGDGLAIVLNAGLPLMDMEAVQFHPTGIVGPGILASETLRSVGGILLNKNLERFMERYAPKMMELAPRDVVSRAMEAEIREGRGVLNPDHNIMHVWIDLRHLPSHVHEVQIPEVSHFFKKFVNLDPKKELCPVRPSNHYHMGGIPTTEWGEVIGKENEVIPGLFAIGECAAASLHGFNRLGTNSILELITMGKFAGEKAAEMIKEKNMEAAGEVGAYTFARFDRFLEATGKESIGQVREQMQSTMTEKVGVFRNEHDLQDTIETLFELKECAERASLTRRFFLMNPEIVARWELENLLKVAMVTAQSALNRRESRGAHYRDDFPERNDEFHYHTLAYMKEYGKVEFGKRNVDMSIFEEKGEYYEKFDLIDRKY